MIRTADDADVGRSVRAYRHHAEVARRLLARARSRLKGFDRRPALEGGPQTRAIALPILRRLEGRAAQCAVELQFWLGAIDAVLSLHEDEKARNPGWVTPVVHDPYQHPTQGITA